MLNLSKVNNILLKSAALLLAAISSSFAGFHSEEVNVHSCCATTVTPAVMGQPIPEVASMIELYTNAIPGVNVLATIQIAAGNTLLIIDDTANQRFVLHYCSVGVGNLNLNVSTGAAPLPEVLSRYWCETVVGNMVLPPAAVPLTQLIEAMAGAGYKVGRLANVYTNGVNRIYAIVDQTTKPDEGVGAQTVWKRKWFGGNTIKDQEDFLYGNLILTLFGANIGNNDAEFPLGLPDYDPGTDVIHRL